MKTITLKMLGLAAMVSLAGCNDEETEKTMPEGTDEVTLATDDIDITSQNMANWTAYACRVADLLAQDAATLHADWEVSYKGGSGFATQFKQGNSAYPSAISCVEQIVDGCADIANEVGTAKIGEPRDLWESGKYTEAVYAVESWYSYHSIEDYANNIRSIQNAFYGSRDGRTEADHSLASYLLAHNAPLYTETKAAITAAIVAIENMAAPFRSHIGNSGVLAAMEACSALEQVLSNKLKSYVTTLTTEEQSEELKRIVENYVDNVVVPTYADLATCNRLLSTAVAALRDHPSDAAFKAAAEAWMTARAPWETSEAFLFGPVDEEGLDPNMDSWPLDQAAIANILRTGDFSHLEYGQEAGEGEVEAAQNVRGFHTLEFLLFKDGKPRTVPQTTSNQ